MNLRLIIASALIAVLAACASTPDKISSIQQFSPPTATSSAPAAAALPIPITNPTLVKDLQATASNLDQAVAIGALPKNDPAPGCLHDFLQRAGVELPPGAVPAQSFKPENAGAFSLGSILYIQVQQAKAAAAGGGITVSQPCLALVGQIHLDALAATAKGAAGVLGVGGLGSLGGMGGLIIPGAGFIKAP